MQKARQVAAAGRVAMAKPEGGVGVVRIEGPDMLFLSAQNVIFVGRDTLVIFLLRI